MSGSTATSPSSGFDHPALFYHSDREYLDSLLPFIADGLAAHEPVAVAVPQPRLQMLGEALGSAADRVQLIDMTQAGRNPGRIIAGVLRGFADRYPLRRVRIIGEPIWPGRTEAEYPACVQHEALINAAFAGRNLTIVCPYDVARLDALVVRDAEATHPVVWDADGRRVSRSYAPLRIVDHYNRPLAPPNGTRGPEMQVGGVDELVALRQFVVERALLIGADHEARRDLELVVTELVTNGLVHGGGSSQVSLWRDDRHLVCEVRDRGHLTDALAGRRPATAEQQGGRGLLLVHHLADLVRVHTSPEGTTVQVYLRVLREAPPAG